MGNYWAELVSDLVGGRERGLYTGCVGVKGAVWGL
jgi:hypothetical protein